jgi:FkbM family methyltransferase
MIFQYHKGKFLFVSGDEIIEHISRGGAFEEKELDFLEQFLTPGHIFWDIGANFGLHTIVAAKKVGRNGQVYAFEPDPKNLLRLRINVLLNWARNVKVIPVAVGMEEAHVGFMSCSQGAYSGLRVAKVPGKVKEIKVHQVTLDGVAAKHNWPQVDFCKMDVEGAELLVLEGGQKFFDSFPRPLLMCEFSDRRTVAFDYKANAIYEWLAARDYKWFRLIEKGKLVPEPPRAMYDYDNLIACPSEELGRLTAWREN